MRPGRVRKALPLLILWSAAPLLLWWVLRRVDFAKALKVLQTLNGAEIWLLLLLNAVIFLLLCLRWGVFLHAQGQRVSLLALVRYRLTAFGITYFTPGPQFGGEPYQVYALHKHHQVPLSQAISAVTLDKLVELVANFTFLLVGILVTAQFSQFTAAARAPVILAPLALSAIPIGYLVTLRQGWRPTTRLVKFVSQKMTHGQIRDRLVNSIHMAETGIAQIFQLKPASFASAMTLAGFTWLVVIGEFFLMARFIGIPLNLLQAVGLLTAARLAFLLPLPGGLGALEASQILAMQILGFDPTLGVSVSLLIRMRDVLAGVMGLWLGGFALRRVKRPPLQPASGVLDHG